MKKVFALVLVMLFVFSTTLTAFAATPSDAGIKKASTYLKNELRLDDPMKEFKGLRTKLDELGYTHVKLQQVVNDIPVFGGDIIVHINKDGVPYSMSGSYDVKAKNMKQKEQLITAEKAIETAKAAVGYTPVYEAMAPDTFGAELYIYNNNGEYVPAYLATVQYLSPEPGSWKVWVNANDGSVIKKYNDIRTSSVNGTGTGIIGDTKTIHLDYTGGVYYLRDLTKPMTGNISTYDAANRTSKLTLMSDTDAIWNTSYQAAGVDGHFYAGVTYDYYRAKFNRNSLDNNGLSIKVVVHYGRNYANAFWNGTYLVFGDGDGAEWGCFAADMDVVAHELTHGVGSYECNLTYSDQSGALDEAIADIMSAFADDYYNLTYNGVNGDWDFCENCYTPNTPGDCYCSYADPTATGFPDHMNSYLNTTSDYGGVHTNCSIVGHAAYTIAQSIGNSKAEQIFYRAYCDYFTSSTNFSQARAGCLAAAADLYGNGSTEYNAVAAGFNHVGIY